MKYVFWGTPRFAAIVLEGLLRAGMPPVTLVCNPNRPVGRKKIITSPPTKQLVGTMAEVLQPEKLDETFVSRLTMLGADLFIVAAYAKIIPKAVLAIPRLGTIGVHPSLLPKYRGASPIQSAIIGGESETGVTLYMMDEKMDHGPILVQARVAMDSLKTDYAQLEKKLAETAADLLTETASDIIDKKIVPRVQDEVQATYTKKFTAEDGFVTEEDLSAAERGDFARTQMIVRTINALGGEPGVWTMKGSKRIKLLAARISSGSLKLSKIQEEGGTPKAA